MFEGFREEQVGVGAGRLHVRFAGSGPAVVLLHGHPRTHTTWYKVAPALVEAGYSVVCPDLRGYGRSFKPATESDHSSASKRVMATDIASLMETLGHNTFSVIGHDRGSYVGYRLALDRPELVNRLAVIDCVPIGEALSRADSKFAAAWWHWFFFAQPAIPERVINADPVAWYGGDPGGMGVENHADFTRAIHDPDTVHAMLEDYRAGLGVDRDADDEDRRSGRQITCPTLVVWSALDDLEYLYGDVLDVWRPWASDVRGMQIFSGHHVAEENPSDLVAMLIPFLAD